jgi:hypothetical protein
MNIDTLFWIIISVALSFCVIGACIIIRIYKVGCFRVNLIEGGYNIKQFAPMYKMIYSFKKLRVDKWMLPPSPKSPIIDEYLDELGFGQAAPHGERYLELNNGWFAVIYLYAIASPNIAIKKHGEEILYNDWMIVSTRQELLDLLKPYRKAKNTEN